MIESQGIQKPYESPVCHGYQGIYASDADGSVGVAGCFWDRIYME